MKKRYLIAPILFVFCVCVTLGVLALLPPRPGVTKANFDRIEIGMTEMEVEAILGRKSAQSLDAEKIMTQLSRSIHDSERHFVWNSVHGIAMIRIDGKKCVASVLWHDRDPTLLEQLRFRLSF